MDSTKLIITDDLWGTALRGYITPGQEIHPVNYPDKHFIKLVESAFWAGNDILMITFPKKVALIQYTLKKAAAHDARAREMIDTSVKKILAVKAYLGLRPFNTFAQ
jgi:beta-glucosidase-like glycosyl hydrolase